MAKRREALKRKLSIADAVSEGFSSLEGLGEEMRESFDNTPESLQQSGVGEARGEAADALEGLSEPDIPESLQAIEFEYSYFPPKKKASRSDRRDEATSLILAALEHLDSLEDEKLKEDIESIHDDLEQLVSAAEDVTFPGMFG